MGGSRDPEKFGMVVWGGGVLTFWVLFCFFNCQHISQPYKGFSFLSSGSVPVFLREPIDTSVFPGVSPLLDTPMRGMFYSHSYVLLLYSKTCL